MTEMPSQFKESRVSVEEDFTPGPESALLGARIIEFFTLLALHKSSLAKITGIAILAGIITSLLLPVRYTATVKILPPRQTQSEATLLAAQFVNSAAGSLGIGATGAMSLLKNPDELYVGLLGSRPIPDSLIREFDLATVYHAKNMTNARAALADHTSIVIDGRSGLLMVSVTDQDKGRAARIANAYIEQLRILTQTLAVTEASQRRLFYEEQLKRTQDALVTAERSFQQVQQTKGMVQPDAQARALITGLADLRAQMAAKEVELQALRSYSTENNPSVKLAENQLSSLGEEVRSLEQRGHSSDPPDLGMEDLPVSSLDFLRAQHELQYQQTLFDLLIKQYDAARLDESKEATIIQVVEPAIPPDQKSSPHRAEIIILFAVLGLVVACAYVLTANYIQNNPELSERLGELRSAARWRSGADRKVSNPVAPVPL
jgi:capsule polysaccharide export protein KpsE/RkpR